MARPGSEAREWTTSVMSAFREAFDARDAKKRLRETIGGERVVPGRHSTQRRGDEATLRRDLSIDLVSLLNATNFGSSVDLSGLDNVRRSILNFGLNDLARLTSADSRTELIGEDLREALIQFEPRLNPETLHIERDAEAGDDHRLRFVVEAEMFCQPADVSVDFVAEVDVGSGKISLTRLADAS